MRPIWLMLPSTGLLIAHACSGAGRAPGLNARVKKLLKSMYCAGDGSAASDKSTRKCRMNAVINRFFHQGTLQRVAERTRRESR